jgi:uncharacterized protein YcaQ
VTALRTVELADARRLAIVKQRLAGPAPRSSPARILDVVRSIRCVQLDPIAVVARSPLLVLRSRIPTFRPAHLDRLLWRDHRLFEYWAHAASIVLTEDYPIHAWWMRTHFRPDGSTTTEQVVEWIKANDGLRRSILRQLRRDGPLPSRAIADVASKPWSSTGWTNERNVDRMLAQLWRSGRIMVAGRRGQGKLWDLAERVLPDDAPRERLSDLEVTRRAAERSLRGLGVATPAHIRGHFTTGRYPELVKVLGAFERQGIVERIEVRDDGNLLKGPWFIHRDDLPVLERIERGRWLPRTTLLSPFDNLIYDRKRARVVFGLDYTMEIYVPKAKRRFGYYAMPLLDGDRFVARIDLAVDRARGVLRVLAATPEETMQPTRSNAEPVAAAIRELAAWTGASVIEVGGPVPSAWRFALA